MWKVLEDRAYSLAPSRFPINTAYIEGWIFLFSALDPYSVFKGGLFTVRLLDMNWVYTTILWPGHQTKNFLVGQNLFLTN